MTRDRFSRYVFLIAGIYGIGVLAPGFFTERMLGQQMPPAITHPEFYYGFFCVALAWQVAFLIIATDPARYRPLICAAIVEKFPYAIACSILLWKGRVPAIVAAGGAVDLLLGILFVIAYVRLKPTAATA